MAVEWGQAQAAVIGSALIDAGCVPEILAEMRPEDFNGVFLTFFRAIQELTAEQTPVDPVTVLAKLGPAHRDTARALMEQTPTSANVRAYIQACKEQSRLRLLRDVGEQLAASATLDEAREQLQKAATVSLEAAAETTVTARELAAEWINDFNQQRKPEFIPCGVACLDNAIQTRPGNFHILAGYTSHGKTSLALQLAWNMAQDRSVGYFSFELTREEFKERLIAMISGADYARVKTRELEGEEMTATGRAASELFKAKLCYEAASGMTVEDIRAKTLQRGYQVIFVDYLQMVQSTAPMKFGRYQAVTEISSGLQRLAHRLNVVVFAMSQLSRSEDRGEFAPVPRLSDLRESGQIEQDADAVIFIHAPLRLQVPRFRILDVAKNRSGRIERFYIDFDGAHQRFAAPSPMDYRIWTETFRKKQRLTREELDAIEAEHVADVKRQLEKEQRKRHRAERDGYSQASMEEVRNNGT
ncbi:MAG: AAA family ATPase [Oscillospiraceae bacterium]|nr:AAA family ATPase [Oscillospiraceae bacterium]